MDKWSSQVLNGSYQQISQNMELNLDIEMNKVGEFTHAVDERSIQTVRIVLIGSTKKCKNFMPQRTRWIMS